MIIAPAKKTLVKEKTSIFIFIHRILPKNMQDLNFFLQENNFAIKRITKKNKKSDFTSIFANANFILESQQNIRRQQLKDIIHVLQQNSQIHGIFFQNQILNLERTTKLEQKDLFPF